jgi:hypothetical protein
MPESKAEALEPLKENCRGTDQPRLAQSRCNCRFACDFFERMKMRLAEIAAVRFTTAHGQINIEEEFHGNAGRWR